MLGNKIAVIYDGAIGGAVARAFASAGASVYVVGRTEDGLEAVANDVGDAASVAERTCSTSAPLPNTSTRWRQTQAA
jgi:NADP-dependent 3-hydroxy acid dehydrogenase YdfG